MPTSKECFDMSEDDARSQLVIQHAPYPLRKNRVFQVLVVIVAILAILSTVLVILLCVEKSGSSAQPGAEKKPLKIIGNEPVQTTSTTPPPSAPITNQRSVQSQTSGPSVPATTEPKQAINTATEVRCANENIFCGYWTLIGECAKNPKYMHRKCCLWCRHLQDIRGQNCTDNHANCILWTNRGECWKNPAYMLDNCCKACNDKGHSPAVLKKEIGSQ